jgi:acyl-CoA-binding protein
VPPEGKDCANCNCYEQFRNKAKYRARQAIVGMSKAEAQKKYIELVAAMIEKYGLQE